MKAKSKMKGSKAVEVERGGVETSSPSFFLRFFLLISGGFSRISSSEKCTTPEIEQIEVMCECMQVRVYMPALVAARHFLFAFFLDGINIFF